MTAAQAMVVTVVLVAVMRGVGSNSPLVGVVVARGVVVVVQLVASLIDVVAVVLVVLVILGIAVVVLVGVAVVVVVV